jgi:assimilatory nitrate reductase catalytic subunit
VVCACFGVGRATICDAIASGARSAADIGARLKAGTNCGSCIPELKRLVAESEPAATPQRLAVAN